MKLIFFIVVIKNDFRNTTIQFLRVFNVQRFIASMSIWFGSQNTDDSKLSVRKNKTQMINKRNTSTFYKKKLFGLKFNFIFKFFYFFTSHVIARFVVKGHWRIIQRIQKPLSFLRRNPSIRRIFFLQKIFFFFFILFYFFYFIFILFLFLFLFLFFIYFELDLWVVRWIFS